MSAQQAGNEVVRPLAGRWGWVAAFAVILLAVVVACNKVWNVDVFWHLKSGQWMLERGKVLGHDPFSVDGADRWVNVHWGFQLLAAVIHRIAGFAGLVVLKMAVFGGMLAVFALWLRRRISPAWLMLAGLWVILGTEARIRVRPEILTYLLLTATLVILESVRRGASTRRLWWLVPINIVWVNVHGVFIVGIAAAWMALAGAAADRALKRTGPGGSDLAFPVAGGLAGVKALLPILVATAACFISPWPVLAALHPLLLRTRISGEERLYSFGVQEFRPTYLMNPFKTIPVLICLLLGVAVLELLRTRRRSVPIAHGLWFLMFLIPAILAVRNVMLFVIPAGLLLAVHGGAWLDELARRHPAWRRLGTPAAAVMLAILAATAAGYATEAVYRWQKRSANRFGLGVVGGRHPIQMAKWLGASELSGDILPLEFGDGGTFVCYAYPRRKVWIDGRLEVQPRRRLVKLYEYRAKMLSSRTAADPQEVPLPKTVRFVAVARTDPGHITALSNCGDRFKLVYVDRAGVCFARLPVAGEEDQQLLWKWHRQEPLPAANLDEFDRPMDARSRRPLLNVETSPKWYRQNVPPAHWEMGRLLHFLGRNRLAVRYLTLAHRLGVREPIHRAGMLARAHQGLAEYQPIEPEAELCDLPVDPGLARALALYESMDLAELGSGHVRNYALRRLNALLFGRHIDAALAATRQYLENLPIPDRWHPGADAIRLADDIKLRYKMSLLSKEKFDLPGLAPAERAYLLLRKDIGLIDAAIAELSATVDIPRRTRMLLGDLYLRKGQTARARREYDVAEAEVVDWGLQMRRGLCAWAEGDLAGALSALQAATGSDRSAAEPAVYLALLNEQLGDYAAAAGAMARYAGPTSRPTDNQAIRLLAQIRARLKMRGYEPAQTP